MNWVELQRCWAFSGPGLQLGTGESAVALTSASSVCWMCRLLAFFTLNAIALRRRIEPGCVEQTEEEVN